MSGYSVGRQAGRQPGWAARKQANRPGVIPGVCAQHAAQVVPDCLLVGRHLGPLRQAGRQTSEHSTTGEEG